MGKISPPSRNSRKADSRFVHLFHRIAVLMVLAGAAGSLGFTIYAGRHNSSAVLAVLFYGWVLSPFVTLLLVNAVVHRKSTLERLALYTLMVLITLGSLIVYSGMWSPPNAKPAFVFLMIPLLSWLFMGIGFLVSTSMPNQD